MPFKKYSQDFKKQDATCCSVLLCLEIVSGLRPVHLPQIEIRFRCEIALQIDGITGRHGGQLVVMTHKMVGALGAVGELTET